MFSRRIIPIVLVFAVLFLCPALFADYSEIRELIRRGDLRAAEQNLAQELNISHEDWELAYLKGLIQPDGRISISELEKSLLMCEDDCEDLISALISAYYAGGDFVRVLTVYDKHKGKLDDDEKSFRARWFAALAAMRNGDLETAEDIVKKADDAPDRYSPYAEILRANIQIMRGKDKDGNKRLNEVISSSGPSSFLALYSRTYQYASQDDMDRALSGFMMLKETREGFIGSDDLLRLMEPQEESSSDGSAERIVGVTYTIQVGTYGERDEFNEMFRQLKNEGWTCHESSRYVDGRKYWVLSVGSFPTVEKAQTSKHILEKRFGGSYRVVILE